MIDEKIVDVVICGAGPSGLMAAITAAEAGLNVALLERMDNPGRKLLATGGGRCNITRDIPIPKLLNSYFGNDTFVKPALKALPPQALLRFFEKNGLHCRIDANQQVYPESDRSIDVLNVLLDKIKNSGVTLHTDCYAQTIQQVDNCFIITCQSGIVIRSKKLVLSCGGKTYSQLGSDGSGFTLAESLSHSVKKTLPGLCGLITSQSWTAECSGLSINDASVYIDKVQRLYPQSGAVLFTHHGISGPAVLDISRYVSRLLDEHDSVSVRVRPLAKMRREEIDNVFIKSQQKEGSKRLRSVLCELLPSRLVKQLFISCSVDPEIRCADVTKGQKLKFLDLLDNGIPLTVTGMDKPEFAMITTGGVQCDEINCKTMESTKVNGLYFCGEIIDVDGLCGGYNLQWAFASGFLAGRSLAML
jgi:predicted Rossmann fold flavoprotein